MINEGVVGKGGVEGVGRAKVVEGTGDRASIGTGEIGGIRMDAQDHVGCPIDLATIRMGRDNTKMGRGCLDVSFVKDLSIGCLTRA